MVFCKLLQAAGSKRRTLMATRRVVTLLATAFALRHPERRPRRVAFGDRATSDDRADRLERAVVVDELFHLRDDTDADTVAQLAAEAERAAAAAAALAERRDAVADFVEAALPAPLPAAWVRRGAWEWRERVEDDRRVWERRRVGDDVAEITLDENAAPATLASEYGGAP